VFNVLTSGRDAKVSWIMPENLEDHYFVVITAFNDGSGETSIVMYDPQSFFNSRGPKVVKQHKLDLESAIDFHNDFVKDVKKGDIDAYFTIE